MRITQAPLQFQPHACAVTGRDDGELIDFDRDMVGIDPHLYLKREIVEEAAQMLGMVPERKVKQLQEQVQAMGAEIDRLSEALGAIESLKEAIS